MNTQAHYFAAIVRQAGLRVPADVSIVGFDDIEVAQHLNPPLTTVRVDKEAIATLALHVELIRRDSVAAPPRRSPSQTVRPNPDRQGT